MRNDCWKIYFFGSKVEGKRKGDTSLEITSPYRDYVYFYTSMDKPAYFVNKWTVIIKFKYYNENFITNSICL